MSKSQPGIPAFTTYPTLNDWLQQEAISFALEAEETFNSAFDSLIASLNASVELLGIGEPLHGGEGFFTLRNQLFQRLVEVYGYSAVAVESSFPKGHLINEYINGRGAASYEAVREAGFSHNFGQLEANRELVEWMRQYNADPAHSVKLSFYGFDTPTEMVGTDSPRQLLYFVLDYLNSIDAATSHAYRQRIDTLIGEDTAWENPAVAFEPTKGVGLSPAATALRLETEELISELTVRRPELVAKGDSERYLEAMHYASQARQLLSYHAALARESDQRLVQLLGIRDAAMADNLRYMVDREAKRGGKVLVFAHNSHLKRGAAEWQLGPNLLRWYPAGAHLTQILGERYVVIGSALGVSDENGIFQPETDTLEARLIALPGSAQFIPTHLGEGLPAAEIAALPMRSNSKKNSMYFPLTPQSISDFDWLAFLDSTSYLRGAPPLPSIE